jgi:hypothetical protein
MTKISERVQAGTTSQNGAFMWVHLFPDDHPVPKHIHPAIRRAVAKMTSRRLHMRRLSCKEESLRWRTPRLRLNVSLLCTVLGPVFPKSQFETFICTVYVILIFFKKKLVMWMFLTPGTRGWRDSLLPFLPRICAFRFFFVTNFSTLTVLRFSSSLARM